MGYTKGELVEAAFEQLGLAQYLFDVGPEPRQAALRRLDAMLGQWEGRGIRLPYTFPATPGGSSLDTDAGVPDYAIEAIYLNLALRVAPVHGKTVSQEIKAAAKEALRTLEMRTAKKPPEMRLPKTLPAGAGNKTWRTRYNPFLIGETRNPEVAPDEFIETE